MFPFWRLLDLCPKSLFDQTVINLVDMRTKHTHTFSLYCYISLTQKLLTHTHTHTHIHSHTHTHFGFFIYMFSCIDIGSKKKLPFAVMETEEKLIFIIHFCWAHKQQRSPKEKWDSNFFEKLVESTTILLVSQVCSVMQSKNNNTIYLLSEFIICLLNTKRCCPLIR